MLNRKVLNIPTEIMRTVVAISELGSLTKAGERLGLSQPAVSAQVKRLQGLVGGELFRRTPNGTTPTDLGHLVLKQARKMLDANDQVLQLSGKEGGPAALRIGLSTALTQEFLKSAGANGLTNVFVYSDLSSVIVKGLVEGYIDAACIFRPPVQDKDFHETIVTRFKLPLVWVRSRDFVVSAGEPIPLVTMPEDDHMIRPLISSGLTYRIVFQSPDVSARMAAVREGLGLTAATVAMVPGDLVQAKEYYLPHIPLLNGCVCTRAGLDRSDAKPLVHKLSTFADSINTTSPPMSGETRTPSSAPAG